MELLSVTIYAIGVLSFMAAPFCLGLFPIGYIFYFNKPFAKSILFPLSLIIPALGMIACCYDFDSYLPHFMRFILFFVINLAAVLLISLIKVKFLHRLYIVPFLGIIFGIIFYLHY